MGAEWNLDFIRSKRGVILALEVLLSILGGIVNSYSSSLVFGILNLAFWSTVCISATFYFLHVCNAAQAIQATFVYFYVVEYGYIAIWSIIYVVASVLSFFDFGTNAIFCYVILLLFIADLFFIYQAYKYDSPPDARAPHPTQDVV